MVKYILPCFFLVAVASCSISRHAGNAYQTVELDTVRVKGLTSRAVYHGSRKKYADLLHSKLDVRFDWEKQHVLGKAFLTFTPWFYPISSFRIDAKGFDIKRVALAVADSLVDIKYDYDSAQITIYLNRMYTRTDTFEVFIDYIAKPNDLPQGGSMAITAAKGLYFINPLNKEDKPQQIWTQGETESNSAWFPTIDSPNEKMTQEIAITVRDTFTTLSNGLLVEQKDNGDGTRTDFWRQDLPHAPYLCMLAVGVYAKTTDYWQRKKGDSVEVSYYVEPEYSPYARAIFGNTPDMISCFSDKLGYKYPWDKFSQVVVRDYVSGAMENTTCVVHGEFLQRTTRELLDNTNEDVISHELFHHWFGDLVTCESWSNLPLNELFATYGEYIWRECKYGRESADQSLKKDLDTYLMESRQKQVDMIRFDYDDREDMFDSHSYAKGGCILHMLRKYVGDDAFFNSLKLFLHRHAFQPVEIHQLRLAFEEVTGEDLNWFFNQWFFASGHPELHISYRYVDSTKQAIVSIEQLQDTEKTPIYKLPMVVDIYVHNKVARDTICLEKQKQDFVFRVEGKPDLINVDAEKMLLCRKTDDKALTSFVFQYYHAPLYLDRYEAIKMCSKSPASDTLAAKVLLDALRDPNDKLRLLAIRKVNSLSDAYPDFTKAALSELAHNDEKASVRAASIRKLSELFTFDAGLLPLFRQALKDSSYTVIGVALEAIVKLDKAAGMNAAKSMEEETAQGIILAVSRIYADFGTDRESAFFTKAAAHLRGFYQFEFIMNYQRFLKRSRNAQVIDEGIARLTEMLSDGGAGYVKYFIRQALSDIKNELEKRHYKLEDKIEKAQKDGQISEEPFKNELAAIERQINSIEEALKKNGDQQFNVRVITTEED